MSSHLQCGAGKADIAPPLGTILFGYGYLPTKNDIPSGGYELWYFLYAIYTTYPLPKNTDDHWVMQNLALLRSAMFGALDQGSC